jgi:hypothetical protein
MLKKQMTFVWDYVVQPGLEQLIVHFRFLGTGITGVWHHAWQNSSQLLKPEY